MFLKNKKAQISLEFLIVLGVVILVVVLFATYYLNLIGKNIDKGATQASASQININIEKEIVLPTITSPSPLTTCGNGVIDEMEVCDTNGPGVFPKGFTCEHIYDSLGNTKHCIECLEIVCT